MVFLVRRIKQKATEAKRSIRNSFKVMQHSFKTKWFKAKPVKY